MDSGLATKARRRRALTRCWSRPGMTAELANAPPPIRRGAGTPVPKSSPFRRREWSAGRRQGLARPLMGLPCDRETRRAADFAAVSPQVRPVVRTGLRIPSRGARVPQWQVCEACRPDAAPPGAPPRVSLSETRSLPAPGSRHDSDPQASTDAKSVSQVFRAGITYFRWGAAAFVGWAKLATQASPPFRKLDQDAWARRVPRAFAHPTDFMRVTTP
jgi:hypothetical protein